MNKLVYLAAASFAMLGFASCSSEEEAPVSKGADTVRFHLTLPAEVASRSFSDGQKATALTYAVYEHDSDTPVLTSTEEVTFVDLHATVELKLVNGKSYDIIWWAATPGNPYYTFSATDKSVEMNYDTPAGNDESRDAFFQHTTLTKVQNGFDQEVILRRPFAQVNVGTNDLSEPSVTTAFGANAAGLRTSLTATTFTTLNLLTGEVSGQQEVTFSLAPRPADEIFPVTGYEYLSMDYLLVAPDKTTQNMVITIDGNGADPIKVDNVPVQRNYRTNIYGQLLTSTGLFQIVIDPIYDTPDYDVDF